MSNCTFRILVRRDLSFVRVTSPFPTKPWLLQFEAFSSAAAAAATPKPISGIENRRSITANYLINKFGFPKGRASTASKFMNLSSTKKPGSVVAFLKKQGFTKEQIQNIVRKCPYILVSDPQNTLLPKLEFFRSMGISENDMRNIFVSQPYIFKRSLHKQITPSFEYILKMCDANGIRALKIERVANILNCGLQSPLLPNLEVLRDSGVPDSNILYFLEYHFRAAVVDTNGLRRVVKEVKNLGFNPSELKFVMAVGAFGLMSKATWEKKMAVYMKWGLSHDEILSAFVKHPYIMTNSESKIAAVMDLLVDKMGFDSSIVLRRPHLVQRSLAKRLLPRCSVYKRLLENGLIKTGSNFVSFIECKEEVFINKFVQGYIKEAPGLLELYRNELANSK